MRDSAKKLSDSRLRDELFFQECWARECKDRGRPINRMNLDWTDALVEEAVSRGIDSFYRAPNP